MNMNPFDQQKPIAGVEKVIAIFAGKGGVGKSTVSVNLALALAKKGLKVGLLDADIYGPSLPRLTGTLGQKPEVTNQNKIIPLMRYGMKLMSIGHLIDEGSAVVWRGPMLFKAMDQFLRDVDWGELDYLIVDLPPGTGDVQLSLAQKVPVRAAIAVSTPQNMSLIDVKKAVDMWRRVGVPVAGLIENMSFFVNPANQEKIQLFPKGDLNRYLEEQKIPYLGEIPFHPQVSQASEMGIPIVEANPSGDEARAFTQLAEKIIAGN